jgi:TRAP transporter TAXI family solute receptor
MKTKKRLSVWLAVMVAANLALGFGHEVLAQPKPPTSNASPASKMPERLIWFSAKPGQTTYMTAVTLSQLIGRYTKLQITVNPYPQIIAGQMSMHKGEADLGEPALSHAYAFTYGISSVLVPDVKEAWPEFRMLMYSNNQWWGWVTRPENKIRTIYDLKGHSVIDVIPGSVVKSATGEASLRAAGLDPAKDVRHMNCDSTPASEKALLNKRVDAIFANLNGAGPEELKAMAGAIVLPFPREVYDRLPPDITKVIILKELPAGYYPILASKQLVVGGPQMFACRDDLNEQAAYLVVKTIMEHARELDKGCSICKELGTKEFALPTDFVIPAHPGAIKYFKEAGMWTPTHEARQKERLAALPKK